MWKPIIIIIIIIVIIDVVITINLPTVILVINANTLAKGLCFC